MTLHEFVKARLKVLYPEVTLSNARIKATADKLSTKQLTVEQETEVDAALTAMNDNGQYTFSELQKEDSRTLQLQILADKGKKPEKKDDANDPVTDPPKSEIEELKELVKGLATTVKTLNAEKQTQSMQQKLSSNEKLKGIDVKLYSKWALPKTDEEIEAFADEVVSTYGHLVTKEQGESGGGFKPGQNRTVIAAGAGKIDPAIKAFAEQQQKSTDNKK